MATVEELAKRIQILEDVEAIKKLKARYAMACDNNYNIEELAKLFTEDAVWDGRPLFGVYQGKKAICEHFKQAAFIFAVHYFVSPEITIEGDKAHSRWCALVAATRRDNTPVWLSGFEYDDYVKIDGQWFQSYMKTEINFYTPYHEGWVKMKIIA